MAIGLWALVSALGSGCGGDPPETLAPSKPADTLLAQFEQTVPADWVRVLDPEKATPGFTLALFRRRLPFLMDLAGRVVHAWPEVRVMGRARLTPDGHLHVIAIDGSVQEYDWEGRLVFRFPLPEGRGSERDGST
ncbi:MAG: hypothetical protein JRH10_15495 [Deltaproteobacteria bacterium]|nr:hypothetical protein [Deltaproteobacteria bacterium]MBW2447090.1 hypothetical protein [Deltaproteobacteria bacterium]